MTNISFINHKLFSLEILLFLLFYNLEKYWIWTSLVIKNLWCQGSHGGGSSELLWFCRDWWEWELGLHQWQEAQASVPSGSGETSFLVSSHFTWSKLEALYVSLLSKLDFRFLLTYAEYKLIWTKYKCLYLYLRSL